jgi:alpha-1,3/alpha-1,6-mannosyltransferase
MWLISYLYALWLFLTCLLSDCLLGPFPVTVYGDILPRHLFYHFHAVCAYLRSIFVALCVLLWCPSFDVILVDQVSVVIPILKLKASSKVSISCSNCFVFTNCFDLLTDYLLLLQIVFYCHFPDLLLAQHTTMLRRLYRKPIDTMEEATTGIVFFI